MQKKTSKIKRTVITALAAVCALTSVTAMSASAKTYTYKHTVSICGHAGANDTTWISMAKTGKCYDLFGSYPTVYDKKTTSTIQSRALYEGNTKTKTAWKKYTLNKNSGAVTTVNYSSSMKYGDWLLNYKYVSGGGVKAQVTTCKVY